MVVRVCCKAGRVLQQADLSQAGPRSGGGVLRRDRRAAWGPLASLPGGGRAESEGGGERELDLEDILKRGKEESASFVFSFDEDEDEDDAGDWMDAHFEGSIKPITEEDKKTLEERVREIEAASKPAAAPREEDQPQTAYSPSAGFSAMTVDDLHDNLVKGSMLVVDVRSRQAYRRAHAKTFPWQSVNIPFTEFSAWKQSGAFEKYKRFKLAIMCQGGKVSSQATVRLTRVYGFDSDKVCHVEGGVNEWILRGFGVQQAC